MRPYLQSQELRPKSARPCHLKNAAAILCLLLPIAAHAADKEPPPAAGVLTGTIKTTSRVSRIAAVDRQGADVLKTSALDPKDALLYEGTIDAKGIFRFDNLLPGQSYDLIVWTTAPDGTVTRWEGASMDYHRDIIPSTPVTPADRKEIEGLITDPPQFYDKVRPLKIAADHQHATVLVELIRTRDFHSDGGGEVIYRVELWYFENLFGGWAKDSNTEKVLARVRGKPADLQKNWQFLPQLGGLTASLPAAAPATTSAPATATAPEPLVLTLPGKPDPKLGVVGGIK
jgi:hypothetical protein